MRAHCIIHIVIQSNAAAGTTEYAEAETMLIDHPSPAFYLKRDW